MAAVVGIRRQVVLLADLGQDLLDQEARVAVAQAVVLVAAVVAVLLACGRRAPGSTPGLMKMPMVTGISFLWIRLSKTIGRAAGALVVDAAAAVLKDHHAGGLVAACIARARRPSSRGWCRERSCWRRRRTWLVLPSGTPG